MCRDNRYKANYGAVTGNYIMDKHNIKSRVNYRNTIKQKIQTNGHKKNIIVIVTVIIQSS
jgi:hypothetical protein